MLNISDIIFASSLAAIKLLAASVKDDRATTNRRLRTRKK